jgi:hypothetical protein
MERLNWRLEGYHIRSHAEFSPDFDSRDLDYDGNILPASPDALQDISEVDIRQNGFKTRVRWQLSDILTAGVEYTFDDYDDRNSNAFDGSVQTFLANLTGVF